MRLLDISLLYTMDLIDRKEVIIKHCSTGKMVADCFSKQLVGKLFRMKRSDIMNVALWE